VVGAIAGPADPAAVAASAERLVARGVTRAKAEDLAGRHAPAAIAEKVEVFDWKLAEDPSGMRKNPAGWLVRAIEDGYPAPPAFRGRADREARLRRDRSAAEEARLARSERGRGDRAGKAVDAYIARLSAAERAALEAEALAEAPEEARRDHGSPGTPPSIRKALLLVLVREHVAARLKARDGAATLF
jgi:hypothetical protein